MSSRWPASLPQKPLPYDYDETEADNVIRQSMDVGPPKQRPRSTSKGEDLTFVYIFTGAQKATFKDWWKNTLKYGALPYEHENPDTDETVDFVFTSRPNYRFVGGQINTLWKCTFNVQQQV